MTNEAVFPDGTPVSPQTAPSPMYGRMLAGQLYMASDSAIARASRRCTELLAHINQTPLATADEAHAMFSELLGHFGKDSTIRTPFSCDYGTHIAIGDYVFLNFGCQTLDTAPVTIGDHCQLATSVNLATAYHPIDPVARAAYWEAGAPITLEDNVWLGAGVTVIGGVTIGANTVVGAGSVVTRDLPANVVAVGCPARPIREITDADRVPASALPEGVTLDYPGADN